MKEQKDSGVSMAPKADPQSHVHDRWANQVTVVDASILSSASVPGTGLIVTSTGMDAGSVVELATQEGVTNVVQECANFSRSLNTAALMKSDPNLFFSHPISSIFDPTNVGAGREKELTGLSIEFQSASARSPIRAQISEFLKQIGAPQGVRENIYVICDELISNVIFNAPYQVSTNEETDPGTEFIALRDTLPSGVTARIFLAAHGDSLLIGCEDSFGSLGLKKVLSRLDRCHFQGVDRNIRWNGRGAGIGLFLVFERSTALFLAVNANVKTVVCSQVSLLKTERARSAVPKSMHWLELES